MPILGIYASAITGNLGLTVDYLVVASGGGGGKNTGGGGGGANTTLAGKSGGSGLVIVRYTKASVGG